MQITESGRRGASGGGGRARRWFFGYLGVTALVFSLPIGAESFASARPHEFPQTAVDDQSEPASSAGRVGATDGTAVVAVTLPPPPPPIEVWPETDPGWQQRKGAAALARVNFPWQEVGFEIRFLPARAGYRAGMFPYEKVIEVWVREELTVSEIAFDIAHELGHAVDWTRGDEARRQTYRELRGYPGNRSWFTCGGCNDFSTPAGDFAEAFAYEVVGPVMFRSQLGPAPTPEQLEALRPLFSL